MKEFINNIIPNLKNASEKLNAEAILKNQQWVLVNEDGITTTTYIFRSNNELLIVVNGDVTSGTWEYITKDKLLIKIGDQMLMYRNQFIDNRLLALKKDGLDIYNVFLNEKVIEEYLNNTLKIESYLNGFYRIDIQKKEEDKFIDFGKEKTEEESNRDERLLYIFFFFIILMSLLCIIFLL